MPWKETAVQDERNEFINAWLKQEWNMSTLCQEFGISRKTGYKWLKRYDAEGREALADRSRAPHVHPNALPGEVAQQILQARAAHPHWGPLKLLAWLARYHPEQEWPAPSTVGALLKEQGLSAPRRRRRVTPPSQPLAHSTHNNRVWCIDFKGWFRTQDGQICYPLTVTDSYSRYLLRVQGLSKTGFEVVQPWMVATFHEHGLPEAIRSDNGPPFAGRGLGGLSRLSVWWIRLGIQVERIAPGKPQQNGRHERMHRTLKAETTRPAQANLRAQQRCFERFREEFNEERPHAALGQVPPALVYEASSRRYPLRLPRLVYEPGLQERRVRSSGEIKWRGGLHYVSECLIGEIVALEESGDGEWTLWFGPEVSRQALAIWDERLKNWKALPRQNTSKPPEKTKQEPKIQNNVLPMCPV